MFAFMVCEKLLLGCLAVLGQSRLFFTADFGRLRSAVLHGCDNMYAATTCNQLVSQMAISCELLLHGATHVLRWSRFWALGPRDCSVAGKAVRSFADNRISWCHSWLLMCCELLLVCLAVLVTLLARRNTVLQARLCEPTQITKSARATAGS